MRNKTFGVQYTYKVTKTSYFACFFNKSLEGKFAPKLVQRRLGFAFAFGLGIKNRDKISPFPLDYSCHCYYTAVLPVVTKVNKQLQLSTLTHDGFCCRRWRGRCCIQTVQSQLVNAMILFVMYFANST